MGDFNEQLQEAPISFPVLPLQKAVEAKGLRDDITCLVVDLFSPEADTGRAYAPVPKLAKSKSMFSFMKKRGSGFGSSGNLSQLAKAPSQPTSTILDFPNVLHDYDLLQPDPSRGERKGGTIHGPGVFCSICGRQMVVGTRDGQGEVSVRAGSQFRCPEHELKH